jgi:hypothetical protein
MRPDAAQLAAALPGSRPFGFNNSVWFFGHLQKSLGYADAQ